jgi:hypothetical protein
VREAFRTREVLFENLVAFGDAGFEAAGDAALEALLAGTDAEGFAGDRRLLGLARARLEAAWGRVAVLEAYRLRSADRVEATFLPAGEPPAALGALPGRWVAGVVHAIEVTRRDELAFRTSPAWRRADAPGRVLFDPGDAAPLARSAGREAFEAAQREAIDRGTALAAGAAYAAAGRGGVVVDASAAAKATSLPASVRAEVAAATPPRAPLGEVVAALAGVAAARDREEGETYARAAGRLLLSFVSEAPPAG